MLSRTALTDLWTSLTELLAVSVLSFWNHPVFFILCRITTFALSLTEI